MFGLNRKKKAPSAEQITAPVRGTLLPMEKVPDPAFSGGLLGPGFAVDPADGTIVAPVAGTIVTVPDTRHAVGLRTPGGAELLIHVGVDTVTLKGEGFTARCAEGDSVEAGAVLLEVDLEAIRDRVPSLVTPVIVTNAGDLVVSEADLSAVFGQTVLRISAP
ncbi:PTS glucose transporter subunit IIA [Brachybacterium vulturis]|uniref:PTS glucose transporter subunit IIA n=1 Tax=Brachybacterium vulturis TaxID=2017484 RepID=A0A291GRU0_9MICO|nr:PTS glucose transporter subunit IIA [Brachybacterium vulturis]ATG52955.1 PTS glucose transporter subunit IIA [Brachybacterium vulturis]